MRTIDRPGSQGGNKTLRIAGAMVLAALGTIACAHSNPEARGEVVRDADCQACFDNIIRRCRQDCGVCGLGQFNWCPVGDNDCLDEIYSNAYGCRICVACTKAEEKACFYKKDTTGKLCEY